MSSEDAVVEALSSVWASMQQLGDTLDETQWKLPTECPGWTVQDNLAHIIGIESVIIGLPEPTVDLPEGLDHVKNELGRSNEVWVESLRGWTGAQVLHEFRVIATSRLNQLRSFTDTDWSAPSWTPVGDGQVRDLIPFRVLDSFVHELDMRRALGKPADFESPAAALTLDRMRGTLPVIVGGRLRPPDGTRIAFAVEGPGGFTSALAMQQGRAEAIDPVPDPIMSGVDVALHMDADTFVRLVGGRGDLDAVASAVRVEGDTGLGRRVLEHMKVLM
jgi:uncharacterized protein (TIGR03083 family)